MPLDCEKNAAFQVEDESDDLPQLSLLSPSFLDVLMASASSQDDEDDLPKMSFSSPFNGLQTLSKNPLKHNEVRAQRVLT